MRMRGNRALGVVRTSAIAFAVLAFAVGVVPGCGLENALVGGACKDGYSVCGADCVDLLVDTSHCGRCGTTCPPGVGCAAGICGGPADGAADALADGARDTSTDGPSSDGNTDGTTSDASSDGSTDGPASDASSDGSTDGPSTDSGDACPPPPYNTAARCGSCFTQCVTPNTECLLEAGNFVCRPPCTAPLEPCNGICVNKQIDPLNCGVCDKICPALICVGGICQGANPGHEVVIGHDYTAGFGGSAQVKVLTNAVLLPSSNPLRILSFEKWADPAVVARVKAFVAAAALGRTLAYTVSNDVADLRDPLKLSQNAVVVVYDQSQMASADAMAAGTSWAAPLLTFAREGGTLVALDGAGGQGEMPLLLRSAGLLNITSHLALAAASRVAVVAPFDQVGLSVVSPYAVSNRSVTLQSADANGGNVTFVVRNGTLGDGDPVVVHKLVPP